MMGARALCDRNKLVWNPDPVIKFIIKNYAFVGLERNAVRYLAEGFLTSILVIFFLFYSLRDMSPLGFLSSVDQA